MFNLALEGTLHSENHIANPMSLIKCSAKLPVTMSGAMLTRL